MDNAKAFRSILGDVTTLKINIDIENIKECLKIKPELANEDDTRTSETLENVYSHRDSIVIKKEFDETSNKSSGYEAQLENQGSLRDLIVYDEDLPMHMDSNVKFVFKDDLEDLYKNHTFKDEIIVGPEVLQGAADPQDGIFADVSTAKVNKNKKPNKNYICKCGRMFTIKKCKTKYLCDHCGKSFLNKHEISSHMQNHIKINKKLPYDQKCTKCPRKFKIKTSLKKHMEMHKNIKKPRKTQALHECDKIKSEQSDKDKTSEPEYYQSYKNAIVFKEDLEDLYKNHTFKDEIIVGPEVLQGAADPQDVIFADVSTAKVNKNKKHSKNYICKCGRMFIKKCKTKYICDHCGKRFLNKLEIASHMQIHMKKMKQLPYDQKCRICPRMFKIKTSLKKHMKMHKNIKNPHKTQGLHECDICHKVFTMSGSLKRHVNVHLGIAFQCDKCSKSYRTNESLQHHKLRLHNDGLLEKNTLILCRYCSKHYNNKSNRNRHERLYCPSNPERAKVVNTRIMQCDICKKTYLHKQSLTNHILLHMGKQPNSSKRQELQCDVCLKKFKSKTGLRLHIQSVHMDAEKFKNHICKKCKKGFIRKYSLTYHEKTCQGISRRISQPRSSNKDESEPKFGCELCLKKYKTRAGLKYHMDTKHLNVDYMCDNCGVSFTRMWSLNCHEKKCLFKKK